MAARRLQMSLSNGPKQRSKSFSPTMHGTYDRKYEDGVNGKHSGDTDDSSVHYG